MTCNKCGAKLKDGATFCGKCGTKVEVVQAEPVVPEVTEPPVNSCEKCGAKLKDGATFCGKCGAKTETEKAQFTYTSQTEASNPEQRSNPFSPNTHTLSRGIRVASIIFWIISACIALYALLARPYFHQPDDVVFRSVVILIPFAIISFVLLIISIVKNKKTYALLETTTSSQPVEKTEEWKISGGKIFLIYILSNIAGMGIGYLLMILEVS